MRWAVGYLRRADKKQIKPLTVDRQIQACGLGIRPQGSQPFGLTSFRHFDAFCVIDDSHDSGS
jgi:hypothetical protein